MSLDQLGNSRSAPASIGAVEVTSNVPSAQADLSNVTVGAGATYAAQVIYRDETGLSTASFKSSNVKLDGPGGYSNSAPTVGFSISGDNKTATVTYTFPAPGGSWATTGNGTYTLTMKPTEVADLDGVTHTVDPGVLGTFRAAVPIVYSVTSGLDDMSGGTLREAINQANANNIGFANVIQFSGAGNSITLNGTELPTITNPIIFQGNGKTTTTISADNKSRIFNFNIVAPASQVENQINDITLTKGAVTSTSGGLIVLTGGDWVTINNSILSKSTVTTGSGGAISFSSTTGGGGWVRLVDSDVFDNSATSAGGFYNGTNNSAIEILRSNIYQNTANGNGGAMHVGNGGATIGYSTLNNNTTNTGTVGNTAGGGAISAGQSNVVFIYNSTLAHNSATAARGGAYSHTGSNANLVVYNSTIAKNSAFGNAGGLQFGVANGQAYFRSSIIAKNNSTAAGGDEDFYAGGASVSVNVSMLDTMYTVLNPSQITVTGSNIYVQDPLLSPLGSYGGATKTIGLLPGSPAINKGTNVLSLPFDQRGTGFPRTVSDSVGPNTDIGAFEGVVPVPTASATLPNALLAPALTPSRLFMPAPLASIPARLT